MDIMASKGCLASGETALQHLNRRVIGTGAHQLIFVCSVFFRIQNFAKLVAITAGIDLCSQQKGGSADTRPLPWVCCLKAVNF